MSDEQVVPEKLVEGAAPAVPVPSPPDPDAPVEVDLPVLPVDSGSGSVGVIKRSMPITTALAGVVRVRALADAAYTEQSMMGVPTEILMLPCDSFYEALGVQPPVVPHVDEEGLFGEGSI